MQATMKCLVQFLYAAVINWELISSHASQVEDWLVNRIVGALCVAGALCLALFFHQTEHMLLHEISSRWVSRGIWDTIKKRKLRESCIAPGSNRSVESELKPMTTNFSGMTPKMLLRVQPCMECTYQSNALSWHDLLCDRFVHACMKQVWVLSEKTVGHVRLLHNMAE